MKITNENFIRHFKRGKDDALEYVIDKYIEIIKAVVYNSLKGFGDSQMIEECISDTFLGAFENAKQFKGDNEDFKKWICTIAKFKAVDYKRKKLREPNTSVIDDWQITSKSAEEIFLMQQSTEELLNLLKGLSKIDQDIFTMKYFLNMSNEKIGDQLG